MVFARKVQQVQDMKEKIIYLEALFLERREESNPAMGSGWRVTQV